MELQCTQSLTCLHLGGGKGRDWCHRKNGWEEGQMGTTGIRWYKVALVENALKGTSTGISN